MKADDLPDPNDLPEANEPDDIALEMAKRELEIQQAAHAGQMAAAFMLSITMSGADDDIASHLTCVWIESKL